MNHPPVLSIACETAIRLFECYHIALANGVSAHWVYNHPRYKRYSRTIEVTITSNYPDSNPHIYVFDAPTLVADHNNGVDPITKYASNNIVPLGVTR